MEAVMNRGKQSNKIPSKKLALYVSFASITMMFAAFTSAYIVRKAAGNWLEFRMPDIFWYSTIILLLSSVTLHFSFQAFKKGNTKVYRGGLIVSFLLGIGFLVSQLQGWYALENIGVFLTGNPSGSFVYVISFIHALHILGGLAAIALAIIHAFALEHKVTPARILRFDLTLTYWHFVDFLWIYLLLFFTLQ